jgi:hypothetical protein
MNKKLLMWGGLIVALGVFGAIYFNKKNVEKRRAKRAIADKKLVQLSSVDSLIANPVLTEE